MTFEEIWKLHIQEELLQHYEELKAVFSEKIAVEIEAEYEVSELIEAIAQLYSEAKRFEELSELAHTLRENNPKLFKKHCLLFYLYLSNYYCYQDKRAALEKEAKDLADVVLDDYELFEQSAKKLLYYGYTDLIEQMVDRFPPKLRKEEEMVAVYWGIKKKELVLERVYEGYQETGSFDWAPYKQAWEQVGMGNLSEKLELPALAQQLDQAPKEAKPIFLEQMASDAFLALSDLASSFMRYAKEYDLPFVVSSKIWDKFCDLWLLREEEDVDYYFDIDEPTFKNMVIDSSSFWFDTRSEGVLLIWGGSYIYDFLLAADLIYEDNYEPIKALIQRFKAIYQKELPWSLWTFSFVHRWKKPDSVKEEAWQAEKALFEASYQEKDAQRDEHKGFFSRPQVVSRPIRVQPPAPVKRKHPKIGRNARVTVQYSNGKIKKDIKYKKVMEDVEQGLCKVVKW